MTVRLVVYGFFVNRKLSSVPGIQKTLAMSRKILLVRIDTNKYGLSPELHDEIVQVKICYDTKAKNAAKQGNAGERPDAAARYTVKSSGVNLLLFYFTGIFRRINSGVRGRAPN